MSKSRKGISLPDLSFLIFDPTLHEADKKKAAPGEAGRPIGEAMLADTTTRPSAPIVSALGRQNSDGINRAADHAAEWYRRSMERGKTAIFSEDVVITPEMAALLLKKNPDNRNLSKKRISEIRADLERGRYVLNGEPIIVSREGLLNDGQHRLIACIESGVTFRSLVVFGVARSSRLTLDQGGARTVADYLDMGGATDNTKVTATVARMLWQYAKHGSLKRGGGDRGTGSRGWPTKAEIMIVADQCEREIQRGILAVQTSSKLIGSYSFVVFCHIVLSRADESAGPIFIERLLDGANLKAESPIFLLRERFINDPKMRQPERFEAVVRAWNAMRKGKPLTKLMIMGSVPKIEG